MQSKQLGITRTARPPPEKTLDRDLIVDYLFNSSGTEDGDVHQVRVQDKGSQPWCARMEIEGVPVMGVVDSGADIEIIGGELFRRVAAVAKLRRKTLKKANKVPKTYDQRPFTLDGRINLDIAFEGTTMKTPIYLQIDASKPLLLLEGVC